MPPLRQLKKGVSPVDECPRPLVWYTGCLYHQYPSRSSRRPTLQVVRGCRSEGQRAELKTFSIGKDGTDVDDVVRLVAQLLNEPIVGCKVEHRAGCVDIGLEHDQPE